MKYLSLTFTAITLLSAALPTLAASEHYAIRAESIVAAMSGVGMQVTPKQIKLLTDVVATSNAPRLRVESIEKSTGHGVMVRFQCENSEECLPFYARIGSGADEEPQPPSSAMLAQLQDLSSRGGRAKPTEMRVGSTATLLLNSERVHISLSVICLENGAVGQKIRVASPDHQRTYMAEVIDGGRLKGSL